MSLSPLPWESGFANRSVEDARLNFGGVAYMVVGVEPSAAAGIPAIDHADLAPGIKTYAATPRFTPPTIRFASVEVLVVVVEPPELGDSAHTLQKQYDFRQRLLVLIQHGFKLFGRTREYVLRPRTLVSTAGGRLYGAASFDANRQHRRRHQDRSDRSQTVGA